MSDSDWITAKKQEKEDRDKFRDFEYCYKQALHENISPALDSAKKEIEEKTLYKIEIRPTFSALEVFVNPPAWKNEKLIDAHFKLKACSVGIFLIYGARLRVELDSLSPTPKTLYSKPKLINQKIKPSTIVKWIRKAAEISIPTLRLTEYAADAEMKNSANCFEMKHRKKILLCCLSRRCLRFLRLS